MKHIILILLFSALPASFIGCGQSSAKNNTDTSHVPDTIAVRVSPLEPVEFVEYGDYYGKMQAKEEATLLCVTGGTVTAIRVDEGEWVKKGTSLASIDGENVTAAYETARLQESMAKDQYERQQKHFEKGNISQVALDQAKLAYFNAKTARLNAAKARTGALCITPMSGIVIRRYIERYQEVGPGTPTFKIARLQELTVSFGVPEKEMEGMAIGNTATVTCDMYPGETWKGKVSRLVKEVSPQDRVFKAEVLIDNNDRRLLPGTTGRVKVVRSVLDSALTVPTGSLITENRENFVMIADNNSAHRAPIVPGPANESLTVVLEGLTSGQLLIVENHHLVSEGSPIRIIN